MGKQSFDGTWATGWEASRRDFLKFSSLAGAAAVLSSCRGSQPATATPEPALKIGYLPITDATPLLIGHGRGIFAAEGLTVDNPVLMRGWPEIAEGFLAGSFNVVHLLGPIPIYMRFAEKHRVKVVAWNHINGSALTVRGNGAIKSVENLGGKQIAIPHWYSMHNIVLQACLRHYNLDPVVQDRTAPLKPNQTNLFVMRPPDMPTALAGGSIDGYIVAEPFNAAGELLAKGTIIRFTGDVFKNHPCCVAVMREQDIQEHPAWAQKVVTGLVKAQLWASRNTREAALMLSKDGKGYLPLPGAVVERAMTKYDIETYGVGKGTGAIKHPDWNASRIGFQPYPFESATREIVKLLKQTHVEGNSEFLKALDPEAVVRELYDYELVKKSIEASGGLQQFDGISPDNPYVRAEVIEI